VAYFVPQADNALKLVETIAMMSGESSSPAAIDDRYATSIKIPNRI
jgi:hypothetical protein